MRPTSRGSKTKSEVESTTKTPEVHGSAMDRPLYLLNLGLYPTPPGRICCAPFKPLLQFPAPYWITNRANMIARLALTR